MLAVRLDETMERELSELAAMTGRSKSHYAKVALKAYLEEYADYLKAIAELERGEPRTSLTEIRKEFDLER